MFARSWWLLVFGALLLGAPAQNENASQGGKERKPASQDPVELRAVPLISIVPSEGGVLPILVRVESRTGNLRGMVVVSVGDFSRRREYRYPLELPAGARKELIVTPTVSRFGDKIQIEFRADRLRLTAEVPYSVSFGTLPAGNLLMVSDLIGGLQLLTQIPYRVSDSQTGTGQNYMVNYCRPEQMPTQGIALGMVSLLMLNDGAERMSQEQFQAIRHWVELGGVLIVPGGAGALYLQHPIVREMLPVEIRGLTQVERLEAVGRWLNRESPLGRATLTQVVPKQYARVWQKQGNLPLIVVGAYGLGAVVFLAFDPTEEPMRSYPDLKDFWQTLLHGVVDTCPSNLVQTIHNSQGNIGFDPWGTPETTLPQGAEFNLPSFTVVFVLLAVYFLLVVPVNYWLLKRVRALDWAWLTTPAIALLFVGLISATGRDLYRKPLSGSIQSVLLVRAGSPSAYGVASALFFFPRAGRFDLRFEQTEMVEAGLSDPWRGRSISPSSMMSTIEQEPKLVQDYAVRNLSFQWFRYTRRTQLPGIIEAQLRLIKRVDGWHVEGFITNRLPYRLVAPSLKVGDRELRLEALEQGKTLQIRSPLEQLPKVFRSIPPTNEINLAGGVPIEVYMDVRNPIEMAQSFSDEWQKTPHGVLSAYLVAEADQPVLVPDLRENLQSSAQNTYWVSIPLEVQR